MDECGICLESKPFFNILTCTHKICNDCYPKLKSDKCPYCRTPFIRQTNISQSLQPYLQIDFEYSIYDFQSRRQKRRQKNKNSIRQKRPRKITNNNPISIFFFDGNIPNDIMSEKPYSPKKTKKSNNKSNKWNYLKNQQNF